MKKPKIHFEKIIPTIVKVGVTSYLLRAGMEPEQATLIGEIPASIVDSISFEDNNKIYNDFKKVVKEAIAESLENNTFVFKSWQTELIIDKVFSQDELYLYLEEQHSFNLFKKNIEKALDDIKYPYKEQGLNVDELIMVIINSIRDKIYRNPNLIILDTRIAIDDLKTTMQEYCNNISDKLDKIDSKIENKNDFSFKDIIKDRFELTLPPINFSKKLFGREDNIKEIFEQLKNEKIIIINGIGGIGKTSICKDLFTKQKEILKNMYKHIAWVDYKRDIVSSFVEAFSSNINFKIKEYLTPEQKFEQIIFKLNSIGEELLIFIDNIDKFRQQDEYLEKLNQIQCHIIITSRIMVFNDNYLYKLGFLSSKKSEEMFLYNYTYSYEKKHHEILSTLGQILKLCGEHALTIELLSKTINNNGITLIDCYNILKKNKFDLSVFHEKIAINWDNQKVNDYMHKHIKTIFSIGNLNGKEKEILFRLSLLATSQIEIKDVKKILNISNNKIIKLLIDSGWIYSNDTVIMNKSYIQIHPTIKYAVKKQYKQDLTSYIFIIENMYITLTWKESYREISVLIPHSEEVLDEFFKIENIAVANLANRVARYYEYLGDMNFSIKYLRKRIKLLNQIKNTKSIPTTLKRIAYLLQQTGESKKAMNTLKQALHLCKLNCIYKSQERADIYMQLGYVYQSLGIYKCVLTNYKKALKIRIAIFGKEKAFNSNYYNNVSMIYFLKYDYSKALKFIDKSLKIREYELEKNRNNDSISAVAQSQSLKGLFLFQSRLNLKEASSLLNISLKTREEIYGTKHIFTATSYMRLSDILCISDCYEEAYEKINEAIEIFLENIGEYAPDTASAYNRLAIIERKNNMETAIKWHEKAINIYKEIYNSKHPKLANFFEDLGDTYCTYKKLDFALIEFRKAYKIYELYMTNDNLKLLEIRNKINSCSK